jgi:hypothetical protein
MPPIQERILKLENKCDEISAEVAKESQTNRGAFLFLRDEQAERHMMLRNAIDGLVSRIERLENARAEDKNSLEHNSAKTAEKLHALEAQVVQLDLDFSGKLIKAEGYGQKHADKLEKVVAEIKDLRKTTAACASDDVPGEELVDTLD